MSSSSSSLHASPVDQPAIAAPRRMLRGIVLAAILLFVIVTSAKAMLAAFENDDFPEALAIKLELLPLIFPVHMITGALALVLVPLALLLRPRRRWHRLAGRIAAANVLVAGLTAFPVAWIAPVTPWSGAGFMAQALVWLVLLAAGIRAIRRRQVARHRACMLLMLATTSGAIFFRIYLAIWAIFAHGQEFELFYACNAWIAWLVPLSITAYALKKAGSRRIDPR